MTKRIVELKNLGIVASKFTSAWWLKNQHLQTIYPSLPWAGAPPKSVRREVLELPDGDATAVDWHTDVHANNNDAPILIVLHGMEGSVDSPYARMLLKAAGLTGWQAAVLHARDCGDYRNRLPRRYHAGETSDVRHLLENLRADGHKGPIVAAGYSLGGNVLLKYLGESAASTLFDAAVAVSVPFNLHDSSARLTKGFSKLYQYLLIKKMKVAIERKFEQNTTRFDWSRAMAADTFAEIDDAITAPLHGFSGKDDYYDQCSSGGYLADIRCPTLIINSLDDPFMTPAAIPDSRMLADHVELELADHGGHVGFITGGAPWKPEYYLPGRIITFLAQQLADTGRMARQSPGQ